MYWPRYRSVNISRPRSEISLLWPHFRLISSMKHVPYFYQVYIKTQLEVWENDKCCGYKSRQESISTAFSSPPKLFWMTSYLDRNTENMLSSSIRKFSNKKGTTFLIWLPKCKFSLLTSSLCQQLMQGLQLHQVNQCKFFLWAIFYLPTVSGLSQQSKGIFLSSKIHL